MKQSSDMPGKEMTDDELVEAVIEQRDKGNFEEADSLAFALIVERYGSMIQTLASHVCGDRAREGADAPVDIFFYLRRAREGGQKYDYLSNYGPVAGSSFKAYLTTVVYNYYGGDSDSPYFIRTSGRDDPSGSPEQIFGTSDGKKEIDWKIEGRDLWDIIVNVVEESPRYFDCSIRALQMNNDGANYSVIKDEIGFEGSTGALKQRIYRLRKDLRGRFPDWLRMSRL